MEILLKKAKVNLDLAKRLKGKDDNSSVSRLYYSVYQETVVLLNRLSRAKDKDFMSNTALKKVNKMLSNRREGSHDRKIKALKIFIGKLLGFESGNTYEKNVGFLQNVREVGDYKNRNVKKDEVKDAFSAHTEIETIFNKIR